MAREICNQVLLKFSTPNSNSHFKILDKTVFLFSWKREHKAQKEKPTILKMNMTNIGNRGVDFSFNRHWLWWTPFCVACLALTWVATDFPRSLHNLLKHRHLWEWMNAINSNLKWYWPRQSFRDSGRLSWFFHHFKYNGAFLVDWGTNLW